MILAIAVIVAGTIAAVPSKDVPPIVLAVSNAVAVSALPVKAPVKPVEVTDVRDRHRSHAQLRGAIHQPLDTNEPIGQGVLAVDA